MKDVTERLEGEAPTRRVFQQQLFMTLAVSTVLCSVQAAPQGPEALGSKLTPLGGEIAASASGDIPAWTQPGQQDEGWSYGQVRGEHWKFKGDKPLYSIDANNLAQHSSKLSPGQVELFKRIPGYRMDVYPTRRTCSAPDFVVENTRQNVGFAKLDAAGLALDEAHVPGIPFPMPSTGAEVMWNMKMRYRGVGIDYKATITQRHSGEGAKDAIEHIKSTAAACPNTKIVLGGYSQGAAVMDVVTSIPVPGIGFTNPLPPFAADHVAAVAVFGNPSAKIGLPLTSSPVFGGRAIDICNAGDPICSSGDSVVAHRNYGPDGSANQVLKTDGSGQMGWVGISQPKVRQITAVFDGQGSAPTVGTKMYVPCRFSGTITRASIFADVSGSCVIDVWKDTYANYPPTVADTIAASAKPTLSTAIKNDDSTLTGWTTSVTAGDVFGFNVDSAATVTRVVVVLEITTST